MEGALEELEQARDLLTSLEQKVRRSASLWMLKKIMSRWVLNRCMGRLVRVKVS